MVTHPAIVPPIGRATKRQVLRRPWTRVFSLIFIGCALGAGLVRTAPADVFGLMGILVQVLAVVTAVLAVLLWRLEPPRLLSVHEVDRSKDSIGPVIH